MEKNKEYYESLDKRTNEYKNWKKQQGLGDFVEKVTTSTGIKSAVQHLFGDDCGCEERKEKLNEFGQKLRDLFKRPKIDFLTKDEYNILKRHFKGALKGCRNMPDNIQKELLPIHNRVFRTKKEFTTCTSCRRDFCVLMNKLYNEYGRE